MKYAIDAGKDVQEQKPMGRRRVRSYRKNLPYTDEEALGVAMKVPESHLTEARELIGAADEEFSKVENAAPKSRESEDENEDIRHSRVRGCF